MSTVHVEPLETAEEPAQTAEPVVMDRLWTLVDVMAYSGLSRSTISRAIRDGRLRAGGPTVDGMASARSLRFRRSDVDEWLFPTQPLPRLRRRALEPVPVDPRSRRRRP